MAQAQMSEELKNALRAVQKLTAAGKPATQDCIAEVLGKSDSLAWYHLKRAMELKLVATSVKQGKVVPGSYHLTPKGEQALAPMKKAQAR